MGLADAVRDAVKNLDLRPEDGATVALAERYASAIDEAGEYGDPLAITKALYLGPHLLKALAELGATPAGRAAMAAKVAIPAKVPEAPEAGQKKGTVTELRALRKGVAR